MVKLPGIMATWLLAGSTAVAVTHAIASATAPAAVEIDNFDFGPRTLTVAAGTTVTWTNHDEEPHTVVSADDPKSFKSGALDTDDKFAFTFARPGTYKYFCSIHPRMTGEVVVK